MKFIIISTADWDNPFWTNKQHVAKTLAEMGHEVVYFDSLGLRQPSKNSSRDLGRIWRRFFHFLQGPRRISRELTIFSPLVIPNHSNALISWLNSQLMRLYLKYFELRLGKGVIFWTYNPLSARFLEGKRVVYHCVDDLTAAPGLPVEKIKSEEKSLLHLVETVFVTSKTLKTKFDSLGYYDKTYYFPNVIDLEHFKQARGELSRPQDLPPPGKQILGFVGAISSYKLDFKLIVDLATAYPEAAIILIGQVGEGHPETNIEVLKGRSNIIFLGPKSYTELPRYLKYFDVALLPCPVNEYTRSMFPMKFFEYLAANKKIVTTKLDSLLDFSECCYLAENAADFLIGVDRALSLNLNEFRSDAKVNSSLADNTWHVRTEKMLNILKGTHAFSEN